LWSNEPKSSPNESNSEISKSVFRIYRQAIKLAIIIMIKKGGCDSYAKNIKEIKRTNRKAVDPRVLPPMNFS